MIEFLKTAYGQVVVMAGVLATFWGVCKAVGALRRWFVARKFWKRYLEKREMPQKLYDKLDELSTQMEEQGKRIESSEAAISKMQATMDEFSADMHNNNEATASMMLKDMMEAYDYYVQKGNKIPLNIRTSLIEIHKQYNAYEYRNHVPHDFEEKIMACELE